MNRIIYLLLLIPIVGFSQINRDSLFNSERTMDRRFTLYKGQLRVEGTYKYYVFSSHYDVNGTKELLSKTGVSSNLHSIQTTIRYGILDYLDAELKVKRAIQNYRGEPVYIIGPPSPSLQLFTNSTTKGFEDIYFGLNGRIPIPSNKLDLGGSLGFYLPSANSESEMPEHTFMPDALGDVITYNYKEHWGYGVLSTYYKGFLKYRFSHLALSASYESRVPNNISENLKWYSQLTSSNTFDYLSETYQYQRPQKTQLTIQLEYQLYQWINVFIDYSNYRSKGAWVEQSRIKIALPIEELKVIRTGYEILVSNKLWFRQRVDFSVAGENTLAPFSMHTTFYYTLFIN